MKNKFLLVNSIFFLLCAINHLANAQSGNEVATGTNTVVSCNCSKPGYGCFGLSWACKLACRIYCRHEEENEGEVAIIEASVINPAVITINIDKKGKVSLKVFDLAGRLVAILADNSIEEGVHQIEWSGGNSNPGLYMLCLKTPNYSGTKMLCVLN